MTRAHVIAVYFVFMAAILLVPQLVESCNYRECIRSHTHQECK